MAQGAVLGLDIGTRVIKLCEIGPGKQGPELLAWGVAPTPQNVISNGVIVDPPALAGAITQLIASAGAKSRSGGPQKPVPRLTKQAASPSR